MPRLVWSVPGTRFYETGVDQGVLYIRNEPGVVWTGLTSVVENPSGGESRSYYIDGAKYWVATSAEEYEATISAYTYPEEFGECDGTTKVRDGLYATQQQRSPFGFSYRTKVGNDRNGNEHGYKIHVVYNAVASPTQRSYSSVEDSVEPIDFSWDLICRQPNLYEPVHIVVDSRYTDSIILAMFEDILYGNELNNARLPTYSEVVELFDTIVRLTVTDHGDGTFTVEAPSSAITMLEETIFQITWPSAIYIDEDSYNISTL